MQQTIIAPVSDSIADWASAQPVEHVQLSMIQIKIIDFIRERQQVWGETPTYQEIADAVGMRSRTSVGYQVLRLQALGVLNKPSRLCRAILLKAVPVRPA